MYQTLGLTKRYLSVEVIGLLELDPFRRIVYNLFFFHPSYKPKNNGVRILSNKCYARYPSIYQDQLVFVAEDDLWLITDTGGIPRRLTANLGEVTRPLISNDGQKVAFIGREEGQPEVYVMPTLGGAASRLTYLSAASGIADWQGDQIIFSSNAGTPFRRSYQLFSVSVDGGLAEPLPYGSAQTMAKGKNGGLVIGRFTADPARWKRYRGGTTGVLWIDFNGNGQFQRLVNLDGNLASPMWIDQRIYFLSDHQGIGNIYSCDPEGQDLQRHTDHEDFYVRNATTDGKRIAYHAGGDLFICAPNDDTVIPIDIDFRSSGIQRNRKFVSAGNYLETFDLSPNNTDLALISRGQAFSFAYWEGAVSRHGRLTHSSEFQPLTTVRHRLVRWLNDGKRLVMVSDSGDSVNDKGDERLEIHHLDTQIATTILDQLDLGRPVTMVVSPKADLLALTNHRNQLILVDLKEETAQILDESSHGSIAGLSWSPDGHWIAYGFSATQNTSEIRLVEIESGQIHTVTQPILQDTNPSFCPEGKYLYFLGKREFNPVHDNLHFDLGFPRGVRPFLLTLQKDLISPFVPQPKPLLDPDKEKNQDEDSNEEKILDGQDSIADSERDENADTGQEIDESTDDSDLVEDTNIRIDLDGIQDRLAALPVPDGRYGKIIALKDKVLFTSFPVADRKGKVALEMYDLEKQDKQTIANDVTDFTISKDGKVLTYRSGARLRVIKAGVKAPEKDEVNRTGGWINLQRIKISVDPVAEWHQMYREAWRLQRDHFWAEDMSGVDWTRVYSRYLPLVDRIASRSEFSDLMWEMQGELGTSHAYESGGDYRKNPHQYGQGYLGVKLSFDPVDNGYQIQHILSGDRWREGQDSPLNAPGINVSVGDKIMAINGQPLDKDITPSQLLVNRAGQEVSLTIQPFSTVNEDESVDKEQKPESRVVTIKTMVEERSAHYREWVSLNRQQVHSQTKGQIGYVHIPDMGVAGYAEFHRAYLAEVERTALIIDVRCNGGGNVSPLILEKLARRRIGYDRQRWGQPIAYPYDSVLGPMVVVTDELAGSDGDIFSHCWKLMGLGKLIGKRTWGGVIGISPKHGLVDGGRTTQPEYSFWFKDVGWSVENYGTDPDIEVDYAPHHYVEGVDPQLDKAIEIILNLLETAPPEIPDLENRPNLALPTELAPRPQNSSS